MDGPNVIFEIEDGKPIIWVAVCTDDGRQIPTTEQQQKLFSYCIREYENMGNERFTPNWFAFVDGIILAGAFDSTGKILESPYKEIVERAKRNMLADEGKVFSQKAPETIFVALDKVNSNFFDGQLGTKISPDDTTYTRVFFTGEVKPGNKSEVVTQQESNQAYVVSSISYPRDETGAEIHLTPTDGRVYQAIASLYKQGITCMSYTAIHLETGKENRPAAIQIDKIKNSVWKLRRTEATIDNIREMELHFTYPVFRVKGMLLLAKELSCIINGRLVEDALEVIETPLLYQFADSRDQLTSAPRGILATGNRGSDAVFKLEDYMIRRILQKKGSKDRIDTKRKVKIRTIVLATVYKHTGDTKTRDKRETIKRIKNVLDANVREKVLLKYEVSKDETRIFLYYPYPL